MMNVNFPPLVVLGAGAFGTALAIQLAQRQRVCLWGRDKAHMHTLQVERVNRRYLPSLHLPETIYCTDQLTAAVKNAQAILIALPSTALPALFAETKLLFSKKTELLLASKGLPDGLELLSTWLEPFHVPYALLSGPSFAKEVAQGLPVLFTLASTNIQCAHRWKERFKGLPCSFCETQDVTGVALYGAMKNIVAIAVGIADQLSLGENTRILLMMQGLLEMRRLGDVLGARVETVLSPAGVGDLTLTCTSMQSRNRQLGVRIGELPYVEDLGQLGPLPEGVNSSRAICQLAGMHGLTLPLCEMVYTILFQRGRLRAAVFSLINHVGAYVAK